MIEPNSNNPDNKGENTGDKNEGAKPPISLPNPSSSPVIEIKADVDLTKKPASVKETINLLDDDALDNDVTKNTEGDNKKKEEEEKKKSSIDDFRKQASQTSQTAGTEKPFNPTLAQQQAAAWVKIIDMGARFGLKAWSGQADNTGLEVSQADKDVLAEQLTIAMQEYKFVMPILLTVLSTLGAMYATPIMNARESKKKIDEFRAKQKEAETKSVKLKPEFDPETGKHKKKKGGQYKA